MRSTSKVSKAAFDSLLAALSEDPDQAGLEYLALRRSLVTFFEVRKILVAEDAADDVLNRLAEKLGAGERFDNPRTYALGIARFAVREYLRSRETAVGDDLPEQTFDVRDHADEEKERRLTCLDECLGVLPPESRELIVDYYRGDGAEKIAHRKAIATRLGIDPTALRNRAVRVRAKLEDCVRHCTDQNR